MDHINIFNTGHSLILKAMCNISCMINVNPLFLSKNSFKISCPRFPLTKNTKNTTLFGLTNNLKFSKNTSLIEKNIPLIEKKTSYIESSLLEKPFTLDKFYQYPFKIKLKKLTKNNKQSIKSIFDIIKKKAEISKSIAFVKINNYNKETELTKKLEESKDKENAFTEKITSLEKTIEESQKKETELTTEFERSKEEHEKEKFDLKKKLEESKMIHKMTSLFNIIEQKKKILVVTGLHKIILYQQQKDLDNQLTTELEKSKEEHDQLRTKFERSKEEHDQLRTELEKSKEEHDQLRTKFERSKEEHDQLRTELEKSKEEHDQLRTKFERSKEEHEKEKIDLKKQNNSLKKELEESKMIHKITSLFNIIEQKKKILGVTTLNKIILYQQQKNLDDRLNNIANKKKALGWLQHIRFTKANNEKRLLEEEIKNLLSKTVEDINLCAANKITAFSNDSPLKYKFQKLINSIPTQTKILWGVSLTASTIAIGYIIFKGSGLLKILEFYSSLSSTLPTILDSKSLIASGISILGLGGGIATYKNFYSKDTSLQTIINVTVCNKCNKNCNTNSRYCKECELIIQPKKLSLLNNEE